MFQVQSLNPPDEQTTSRKTTWFVSLQAVPMELKGSFSMGYLLTVTYRHYRPSDCRSSEIVLEPNVMIVTSSQSFWQQSDCDLLGSKLSGCLENLSTFLETHGLS